MNFKMKLSDIRTGRRKIVERNSEIKNYEYVA